MQFRLKISVLAKGGNRPLLERVIDLPDSKSLCVFPFAKSIEYLKFMVDVTPSCLFVLCPEKYGCRQFCNTLDRR